jgi:hypothetical protein
MAMNSSTLRHIWMIVEATQTSELLRLSNAELVQRLLLRLDEGMPLTHSDIEVVSEYVHKRITLIRDLANSRQMERGNW